MNLSHFAISYCVEHVCSIAQGGLLVKFGVVALAQQIILRPLESNIDLDIVAPAVQVPVFVDQKVLDQSGQDIVV
jgi:hypothetical protein